ncbi:hypothetical protein [Bradyrhizobium sp. 76]|uniref:hypothetical protein n=1 Tax=Bradyrhizobium sp. 76 TaxID=2782680 RepID=UPI001FF71614|nr:hypothetical protein [Bradyrhizobium sp. 76]MCK1404954.1 hypothetical protein [Bradyrhizobium sp. 76]
MRPPLSVLRFEILLYAALALDAISLVFADRRATTLPEALTASAMILLQAYFVWLSAQQRYAWPRLALALCLVVAIFSLVQITAQQGVEVSSAIGGVSCALTVAGLCFAFSRSTTNWFSE